MMSVAGWESPDGLKQGLLWQNGDMTADWRSLASRSSYLGRGWESDI